ncbi:pseudaminic acid synthase [Helicobacter saguini]|uniref:pseudaminic acid synthase n=1 Tax=Helicobacter saguini TaxID=1548018 RepID=UPI0009DF624C|nr:pseudaminic acid synthase [Helicobacter saguini]
MKKITKSKGKKNVESKKDSNKNAKIKKINPVFIIAELSGNHNNDLNIALKSVEAVAKSGADAIKFQTYTPECLTLNCKNEYFRIKDGLWKNAYLWDLYDGAQMPWEWHERLFLLAKSLNLVAFSSPFSVRGVEFLEKFDCPIYKIASFEVMHTPLLRAIAATRKPVIISLGVATLDEIDFALEILRDSPSITLLYCISQYPAKIKDAHLSNIIKIKKSYQKYNIKVGISDHTLGLSVPIFASICGASVIEKHFILDKNLGGVDSAFSLDSNELNMMVKSVREVCELASDFETISFKSNENSNVIESRINFKKNTSEIIESKIIESKSQKKDSNMIESKNIIESKKPKKGREFARSLFISKDVKKGEILTLENIAVVRPSNGLSPLLLDSILGLKFAQNLKAGTPLKKEHFG